MQFRQVAIHRSGLRYKQQQRTRILKIRANTQKITGAIAAQFLHLNFMLPHLNVVWFNLSEWNKSEKGIFKNLY